jgi:hypothetical protein
MSVRQTILLGPPQTTPTPFLRYSCKLFVALSRIKSFGIKQIRTLLPKCPGWAYLTKPVPAKSATYKLFFQTLFANQLPLLCFHELTNCPSKLVVLSPLCFHTLTNCFSRKPLVFTTMRIARGWGWKRSDASTFGHADVPSPMPRILSATTVPRAYCAQRLSSPTWPGRTESLFGRCPSLNRR